MRRASVLLVSAAGVLGVPAAFAASDTGHGGAVVREARVSVGYGSVAPTHVDIVAGDDVTWSNDSVRRHTVTADDRAFDSGTIPVGGRFKRRFDTPGVAPYHCELHPSIRGEVAVHEVLLEAPSTPAAPGRPFPLYGRTALEPGRPVVIEADAGEGFAAVAGTTVGGHGEFEVTVTPQANASYRAVIGDRASAPVALLVLNRSVRASAMRIGRAVAVTATVTPASPRATVVLQLYLRERFGWWPVQRARLDARSRATFRLPLKRTVPARVVLTLPDGATALARSRALRIGPKAGGQRVKTAPSRPPHPHR